MNLREVKRFSKSRQIVIALVLCTIKSQMCSYMLLGEYNDRHARHADTFHFRKLNNSSYIFIFSKIYPRDKHTYALRNKDCDVCEIGAQPLIGRPYYLNLPRLRALGELPSL